MTTYIFLLITILILLAFAYRRFNYDILSPAVITCAVFCFSILLATIGLASWNNQDTLNSFTLIIYISGISAFICGEIIARKIYFIKNPKTKKDPKKTIHPISIHKYLYIGSILFIVLTIFLLVLELKRVCATYGFESNSIPKLLAFYRSKTSLFNDSMLQGGADINFIVKQMKKVVDILSLIFTYITINNFFCEKTTKLKIRTIIKFFSPVMLCFVASLLTSGRSLLMHMIVTAIMIAIFYIYQTSHTKAREINRKILKSLAIVVSITLVGFYAILPLVGRTTDNSNIVEYISFYLGAPIPSLNAKTTDFKKEDHLPGEKTFTNMYYTLNRYKIIKFTKPAGDDWTKFRKFGSNVYSSFYPIYYDFGILGVIILQFIAGLCIAYIYLKVRYRDNRLLFIIYCFYAYVLIDQIRGEAFYSLLSSSTIIYLVLIAIAYYIYIQKITYHDINNLRNTIARSKLCQLTKKKNA